MPHACSYGLASGTVGEMARKRDRGGTRSADLLAVVGELKDCAPASLETELKRLSGSSKDGVALAAAFLLSSTETRGQRPRWLDAAFEVLENSKSRVAAAFLKQAALHARNADIRLAAVRHLNPRKLDEEIRRGLHQYAREVLDEPADNFERRTVSPVDLQVAALHVLSLPGGHTPESVRVVWELITELLPQGRKSPRAYASALDCLASIADPSLVSEVVKRAASLGRGLAKLDLLSICANVDQITLQKHRDALEAEITKGLRAWTPGEDIREEVCTLASKLARPEFLKQLVAACPTEGLDTPRGKVIAAVIDEHTEPDDTLCGACLSLADNPGNTQLRSACLRGLHRCRDISGPRILMAIWTSESRGVQELRIRDRLLVIFGDQDQVLESTLAALAEASPQAAENAAPVAAAVFLACVLPKLADVRGNSNLDSLARTLIQRTPSWSRETREAYLKACDEHELWPALSKLVQRLTAPEAPEQLGELLSPVLSESDELAHRVVEIFLQAAASATGKRVDYPPDASACARIEAFLADMHLPFLGERIEQALVRDGRLSRYALSLARRLGLDFFRRASNLLKEELSTGDRLVVIEELTRAGTHDALPVLSEAIGYVSDTGETDGARIRAAGVDAVSELCDPCRQDALEPTEECMMAIHGRFRSDTLAVRKKAYEACGRISSFASIGPLTDRRATEQNAGALALLDKALVAIRQRLVAEQPVRSARKETVAWLEHASKLSNPELLPAIEGYLADPHPDPDVLCGALDCLMALGSGRALEICRRYREATSPDGQVLAVTRRAIAVLSDRHDLDLLDALPWLVGEQSELLDPDKHNYEELFGRARCHRLAGALAGTTKAYGSEDWDAVVTRADTVGHLLTRHLYEAGYARMGLSEPEAQKFGQRDYQNLLNRTEFRNTYLQLSSRLRTVHDFRQEATTPHAEERDGTDKPGIRDKSTADTVRNLLREAFELVVTALEG